MLLNQVPEHLVQHSRPYSTNVVHLRESIRIAVHMGISRLISRVDIRPKTSRGAEHPRAHRIVSLPRVVGLQADRGSVKVTPAFAHTSTFEDAKAP